MKEWSRGGGGRVSHPHPYPCPGAATRTLVLAEGGQYGSPTEYCLLKSNPCKMRNWAEEGSVTKGC